MALTRTITARAAVWIILLLLGTTFQAVAYSFQSYGTLSLSADTTLPNLYRDLNYKRGDVDKNGKHNVFDLLALLKAMGGSTDPLYTSNADVELPLNGKINVFDLLAFLKILGNKDPEFDYTGPSVQLEARVLSNGTAMYKAISPDSVTTLYTRTAGDSLELLVKVNRNDVDWQKYAFTITGPNGTIASQDTIAKVLATPGDYTVNVVAVDASPNANETRKTYEIRIVQNGINVKSSGKVSYNEDMSGTLDLKTLFEKIGDFDISYRVSGFSNVNVAVDANGNATVTNKTKDYNGTETGAVEIVSNGAVVGTIPLEVKVNMMDDGNGRLIDNRTKQPVKGKLNVDGNVYETDATGFFSYQTNPSSTHIIKGMIDDGNGNQGFVVTGYVPGNQDVSGVEVVSQPAPLASSGVSMGTFRTFFIDGNTMNMVIHYCDSTKASTILPTSERDPIYNLSEQQMITIRDELLQRRGFDVLGVSYPVTIADSSVHVPNPRDKFYVYGDRAWTASATPSSNGLITDGSSRMSTFLLTPANYGKALQELFGPRFMPFEVGVGGISDITENKTTFHYNTSVTEFQPADIDAFRVARQFGARNIHVDNVLALPVTFMLSPTNTMQMVPLYFNVGSLLQH